MKVVSKVQKLKAGNSINLVVTVPMSLAEEVDSLQDETEYSVTIETIKKRRSLDANAFAWVLMQKIADKVGNTKEEIYRKTIKECGNFTVIPIKEDAVERFNYIWQAHGIGWLTDILGKCRKTEGYVNLLAYHGSSTYNTQEMSRLIDILIDECKELGIEVISEQERTLLISEWRDKNENNKQI